MNRVVEKLLFCFLFLFCNGCETSPLEVDAHVYDDFKDEPGKPDLVQAPADLAHKIVCETQLVNAGSGEMPILLANASGFALAANGEIPRVLQYDKKGDLTNTLVFPASLNDCPFQGQTCKGRGNGEPFRFGHGAAEPDGFLLDVQTDYYADLVVKVQGQTFTRLTKDPRSGFTFGFGGGVFTDDGAYAVTLCGGAPYACLSKRTAISYDGLNDFIYGVEERGRYGFNGPLSMAYLGDVVAFGAAGNKLYTVVADTFTNKYVEVALPNRTTYPPLPIAAVKRVLMTSKGEFLTLWFEGVTDNWQSTHHAAFVTKEGKLVRDSALNPGVRDIARVGNGFVGVIYYPIQRLMIGFMAYDGDMNEKGVRTSVDLDKTYNHNNLVAHTLPTIACVDANHCAAAWPADLGIFVQFMVCE